MNRGKKVGGLVGAGLLAAGGYCYGNLTQLHSADKPKNQAFVFIKPHAVTKETKTLVKEGLISKGLNVSDSVNLRQPQAEVGEHIPVRAACLSRLKQLKHLALAVRFWHHSGLD
eukprot:4930912-Amphidinium_carterae.2